MGQLSGQGQKIQKAFQELSRQERAEIISREVRDLGAEVAGAAPTAGPQKCSKAQTALTQGVAEKLITKAGGIFNGEMQLKELGAIEKDATIPPVPEKLSKAFLNAAHPVRGGKMAGHIILGFDPNTHAWCCFEKTMVPGSLGTDGRGLSGSEQDKLLLDGKGQPRTVQGMEYISPTDYRPIKSVLDTVIKLHFKNGGNVEDLPFFHVSVRTADTQNADRFCRVTLGYWVQSGSFSVGICTEAHKRIAVGLLAGWNLCSSFPSAERSLSSLQASAQSHRAVLGAGRPS